MSDRTDCIIRETITEADIDVIHRYLAEESYWAKDIPRDVVERSIRNSLPFAVYVEGRDNLVGFARVVTDRATFAYLADVLVLPEYRGRGLSKVLMQAIMDHPDLQGLRRFLLMTRDAHSLYAQFGFEPLTNAAPVMHRHRTNLYAAVKETVAETESEPTCHDSSANVE